MNPWNINIQTERFKKYPLYILFIVINIYMIKTLPITNLIFCQFLFLRKQGVGQNFNQIFYNFLHENDTQFFTTEDKLEAGKKDKILYVVKKNSSFAFLYRSNRGCRESWYLSLRKRKFLQCTFEYKSTSQRNIPHLVFDL